MGHGEVDDIARPYVTGEDQGGKNWEMGPGVSEICKRGWRRQRTQITHKCFVTSPAWWLPSDNGTVAIS